MITSLYDSIGKQYRNFRLPDPRIAAILSRELAHARAIVNLGAGVGSKRKLVLLTWVGFTSHF